MTPAQLKADAIIQLKIHIRDLEHDKQHLHQAITRQQQDIGLNAQAITVINKSLDNNRRRLEHLEGPPLDPATNTSQEKP